MGFDTLFGNENLKERLTVALAKNHLSHCFLITGPVGSGKHTLATLLAAALQCKSDQKPCLTCSQCRKVLENVHPDLISVTDKEHKAVAVKLVREACADLYVRPNEGNRKIYIFPQELNPQGQNALLKCIEEPPMYGTFFLLAEHAEQMLPTIRSRCVELRLSPLPTDLLKGELQQRFPKAKEETIESAIVRSGGYLGQAVTILEDAEGLFPQTKGLFSAMLTRSPVELLRVTTSMEGCKREKLRPILQQWYTLLSGAAACQSGLPAPYPEAGELAKHYSTSELLNRLEQLQTAMTLLDANVGIKHLCGLLAVTLK